MNYLKYNKYIIIIVRLIVGVTTVCFLLACALLLSDFYNRYEWNWVIVIFVLIVISGFLFGSYLIGTLIHYLIHKIGD